ncbi:MAG: FAD-binding oxidoreductase [Candidatus Bathyarchaeota archaeon]|jgi:glycolate oxidase|nr:FAD-binding oxidoreductase [Candidatus Bathyarchaeota archaeon]
MNEYGLLTQQIKRELEEIVGVENVFSRSKDLEKHAIDESLETPHLPHVIVKPGSTREVSNIMKIASRGLIPVTPQGSRTGLSGGSHPLHAGIAMSLERMTNILEIDEDNLMAVVEPGVLIMDLHEETEKLGLLYPPDPGQGSGTLGGNISTNAGGVRGMKYGVTRDFVQGLEAVLPNGEVINVGGKLVKNSTAYSLLDIIIGSEGTLAIVTKAILRLVPKPQYTALLYVPFESTKDAARTVSEIIRRKVVPFALEYIPRHAILIAEKYLDRPLPDNSHPAYLLIGIEGNSKAEVEENLETAGEVCLEMGGVDAFVADTAQKQDQLWEARKCLFDAYKAYWEIDEVDACVPRNRIPDYIEGAERVAQEKGVIITNIGHAGDGNVHSLIAMEKHSSEDWHTTLDAIIGDLIDIALNLGGTISGEHGLGLAKKRYLARQVGETQVELMRAIKRGFDPHNILNPGKVFDIV